MLKRLVIILTLCIMGLSSFGQGISTEYAYSLLRSLNRDTKDIDRMHVYLIAAQSMISKAGEYEIDFDSARMYMQKADRLNEKLQLSDADAFQVVLESLLARERQEDKKGKSLAERAVNLLKTAHNRYYAAVAYFTLSEYYSFEDTVAAREKRRLVQEAANAFHYAGYVEQEAYCLKYLADLYAIAGERKKAIQLLDQSVDLYKTINFTTLHAVYIIYSNIYYTEGDYKQALKYALLALKSAQANSDTSLSRCQINNTIGIILGRLKEYNRAFGYYQDALRIAQRHNANDAVLQVMSNIVDSYVELKRPEEALAFMRSMSVRYLEPRGDESYIYAPFSYMIIYNELKNYKEVQAYANKILALIRFHRPSDKMLHRFYNLLISYYLQSRQYLFANAYIGTLDSLGRKIGDRHCIGEGYFLKFRVDTAMGRYKSAYEDLLKYQQLHDSLFNETSNRQIRQLQVEYERENDKNEITQLNQKNQLQQNRLEREKMVRYFTIAMIVLLSVIIALLYRQYTNKQKSNKVILEKNRQLQRYLAEKEWLVKEIHHRVKNNFHVVSSLLEIQSSYLENKAALAAIKESQNRIHSMSIIHQKLYQSETFSTINMPEYIYELVEYLKESYSIREDIVFSLQIENIELNHASAITLGLILNEAITNSIKYAFTNTEVKNISISLSHISDAQLLLRISDNGSGLPADFIQRMGKTMGMELLQGLTDDLDGSLSIETRNGTHVRIIFGKKQVEHTTRQVIDG